jgi:hypothetical protein
LEVIGVTRRQDADRAGSPAASGSGGEGGGRLGNTPNLAESAARTVMVGTLRARRADPDCLALVHRVVTELVRGAGDVGANIGDTVKGAVSGTVRGSRETGLDVHQAAEAAAFGALEGAADLGESAVECVRTVVTGTIDDVRPVERSVFARCRRTP